MAQYAGRRESSHRRTAVVHNRRVARAADPTCALVAPLLVTRARHRLVRLADQAANRRRTRDACFEVMAGLWSQGRVHRRAGARSRRALLDC